MKNIKYIFILLALLIASCTVVPQGEQGVAGPIGPQGPPGISIPGADILVNGDRLEPTYDSLIFNDKTEFHRLNNNRWYDSQYHSYCTVINNYCLPDIVNYCVAYTDNYYADKNCIMPILITEEKKFYDGGSINYGKCDNLVTTAIDKINIVKCVDFKHVAKKFYQLDENYNCTGTTVATFGECSTTIDIDVDFVKIDHIPLNLTP